MKVTRVIFIKINVSTITSVPPAYIAMKRAQHCMSKFNLHLLFQPCVCEPFVGEPSGANKMLAVNLMSMNILSSNSMKLALFSSK